MKKKNKEEMENIGDYFKKLKKERVEKLEIAKREYE
jgi:hypothetical protein